MEPQLLALCGADGGESGGLAEAAAQGAAALPCRSWVARCAARLQQRWKSIDRQRLDDLAGELMREERLRRMEPEAAAVAWLRQGIPGV